MKLNKPPVSEEQSALEEYVDFLLTDLSNVTPIRGRQTSDDIEASKSKPVTEKSSPQSDKRKKSKPRLDETQAANDKVVQPEVFSEKKQGSARTLAKTPESHEVSEKTSRESISKITTQENEASQPEEFEPEKEIAEKAELEKAVSDVLRPDVARTGVSRAEVQKSESPESKAQESEEEEALRWDALLKKEKNEEQDQIKNEEEIKVLTKNRLPAQPMAKAPKPVESRKPQFAPDEADQRLAKVEKLLARITVASRPMTQVDGKLSEGRTSDKAATVDESSAMSTERVEASFVKRSSQRSRAILPEVFQTLIFEVGKLPLSVPLLKLGGIVKVSDEDITPLVGTPDWFMGLVPNDRGNLMVVDTQKFLMPERGDAPAPNKNQGQSGNDVKPSGYEYLILLDDSNWALACNTVGDAKNLTQDDIRWSEKSSKRPWFAGMVVEFMSALIEVDELINMLASNISE